jgi:hypothetical protein
MANRAIIISGDPEDRALLGLMQERLRRYATPWHRRARLVVETVLADAGSAYADPARARERLAGADHVVLVSGPVTAQSAAIDALCRAALQQRPAHRLLLATVDGAVAWSKAKRDFNWSATTAVPRALGGAFASPPSTIPIPRAELAAGDWPPHPRHLRWLPLLAAILAGTTAEALRDEQEIAAGAARRALGRVAAFASAAASLAMLLHVVPEARLWETGLGFSALASRPAADDADPPAAPDPAVLRAELARAVLKLREAERERDEARNEASGAELRLKQFQGEAQHQRAQLEALGKSCTELAQDRETMLSHAAAARARLEAMEREMTRQRGKLNALAALCNDASATRLREAEPTR